MLRFWKTSILILFISKNIISQNKDIEWLLQIQNNRNEQYNAVFQGISVSVYPAGIVLPLSYFSVACIKKDSSFFQKGIHSLLSLSSNILITTGIKYAVNRTRPYEQYSVVIPIQKENTPSFPSGHSSLAFNIATQLSLQFPKWYVIVPAYLYAGFVGYSRLYMAVHYPSDVLAGAVIGSSCAYLSYLWYKKYLNKNRKKV